MATLRSFPLVRITRCVPVGLRPRASLIGLTNGVVRGIGFTGGTAQIGLIRGNGGIEGISGIWGIRGVVRCMASESGEEMKGSARLGMMSQIIQEAEERARTAGSGPTPKITLEHVTVNFARSGGPGGQNVNKVNTKVDMRFNVKEAHWLSERVREKILQMEKNRINKFGELVISSTRTRTQKGNIDDALEKIQAIIDAASYVPPPPTEEQKKRIAKLAAKEAKKRLENKKALSDKKKFRRNRGNWD